MPALILPPLRRTAADAAKFASIVHEGQTDKAGRPYVEHLGRVAAGALRLSEGCPFWSDEERDGAAQIAWLHDAVEDAKTTEGRLHDEGFRHSAVYAVSLLTRDESRTYRDFIDSICRGPFLSAILVKLADVEDNADPERLALIPEPERGTLPKRYARAKEALQAAARAKGWRG